MADPLQHVNPGDPLVVRADTFNLLLDAAKEFKKGPRVGAGPGLRSPLVPAVEVYVVNGTGSTLPEWSVVTPTGYAVSPVTDPLVAKKTPVFDVDAPTAADDLIFITVESIADGEMGRAVAAGVVVASVNVTSTAHEYAVPVAATTLNLASAATGPARLAVPAASTGTANRLVVLGSAPPASASAASVQVYSTNVLANIATNTLGTYADIVTNMMTLTTLGKWLITLNIGAVIHTAGGITVPSSVDVKVLQSSGDTFSLEFPPVATREVAGAIGIDAYGSISKVLTITQSTTLKMQAALNAAAGSANAADCVVYNTNGNALIAVYLGT